MEESELVAPLEWAAVESRPEEEPVGEAAGLGARAEAAPAQAAGSGARAEAA